MSTYDQSTPQNITGIAVTAYFMGGAYEVTTDASNVTLGTKKYYSIAGMTVAMNDGSGLQYLLTDHLGSVVAITNASGTLTSQQRYLPFGQVRTDLNGPRITNTDFGYTGQRNNSYINLLDYRSRWMDPQLGRFVSPDTIIPSMANPQSWNRYTYTLDNPINSTDPTGNCTKASYSHKIITDDECEATPPTRSSGGGGSNGGFTTPQTFDYHGRSSGDFVITSLGPSIGQPGNAGVLLGCSGCFNGTNDGFSGYSQSSIYSDGTCEGRICALSGGSVPLNYGATYNALIYTNLITVTLHERYWLPSLDLPLLDNSTFGGSTLVSRLSNGQQTKTILGKFTLGNFALPSDLKSRDTQINYWGPENFPVGLSIQIIYGSANSARSVLYPLSSPFLLP